MNPNDPFNDEPQRDWVDYLVATICLSTLGLLIYVIVEKLLL